MVNNTASDPIVVPPSEAYLVPSVYDRDGNDGPWSTFSIHVGTPPQPTRVLVSTTVGETWVISDNQTQGGCLSGDPPTCPQSRGGLINVNASSTWQDQGIFALGVQLNLPDYINNYDNGNYGLESLGLGLPGSGGVILDNQVVAALATKDFYLGNLGVTSRPTNFTGFNDPKTSFLSSLQQQGHIPSLTFGYSAGNQYRLKKVLGSLTLGGYDQSRFTPNGVSFQFATDISRDLVVGLQSITYNDAESTDRVLLSESILTFVDATVPHIWLPKDACKAFEKAFNLQYNTTVDRYLVNDTLHDRLKTQNPSVSFILGNDINGGATVNITLPYAAFDLQVGPPIVNSTQRYFPLRQADNDTQYTLGRTFLQESYLIVDYERSNFSISQSLFESNAPQRIIAIPSTNNTAPGVTRIQQSSSFPIGAIIGIVVASVVLALAGIAAFLGIRRRRQRKRWEEHEKRKAEEFDPMAKPEMDGSGKPTVGELYAEGKLGTEMDSKGMNEMEGSRGGFYNNAKKAAEMEGTKGGHEMHAGDVTSPVEMWAGPDGLVEMPSPHPGDSGRPSPASRIPSSSKSERPSPASASDSNRRSTRALSWSRRDRPLPSLPRNQSDISSPTDEPPGERGSDADLWGSRHSSRPTGPPRAITPQDFSSPSSRGRENAQRDDDLTRQHESSSRTQNATHLSVCSPTSESSQDRWNNRFGSKLREVSPSAEAGISSPRSQSKNRERRLTPTPLASPQQEEVNSPSIESPRPGVLANSRYNSRLSRVSGPGPSSSVSSPSTHGRGSQVELPGGFF
ncbi:MAG: hypothetical protein Q9217_001248 [Psora testacea]